MHMVALLITLRIATFNVAMGLEEPGQLGLALTNGDDPAADHRLVWLDIDL